MKLRNLCLPLICVFALLFTSLSLAGSDYHRGIYLTQYTAMNTKKLNYFIQEAKATGINTFVIDTELVSKRYGENMQLLPKNGIRYVARIIVFPGGANAAQLKNKAIWEKKWKLVKYALDLGASEIQLDYIRYSHHTKASDKNAEDVVKVIKYFRNQMSSVNSKAKLQVDVFGIATIKPSVHIGQNLPMFAETVDAINPMVYPSHYEPFLSHSQQPYKTVLDAVTALRENIKPSVNVYAWIEVFNYRYPMSYAKRVNYIEAEIQAAKNAGASGWYAWSPNNKYTALFDALKRTR